MQRGVSFVTTNTCFWYEPRPKTRLKSRAVWVTNYLNLRKFSELHNGKFIYSSVMRIMIRYTPCVMKRIGNCQPKAPGTHFFYNQLMLLNVIHLSTQTSLHWRCVRVLAYQTSDNSTIFQPLAQADKKDWSKYRIICPFVRGISRWMELSLTKCLQCGNPFYAMTSWYARFISIFWPLQYWYTQHAHSQEDIECRICEMHLVGFRVHNYGKLVSRTPFY